MCSDCMWITKAASGKSHGRAVQSWTVWWFDLGLPCMLYLLALPNSTGPKDACTVSPDGRTSASACSQSRRRLPPACFVIVLR